jgi:hypothetical protein
MNKVTEKLTKKVVSKPKKYLVVCSLLITFFMGGLILDVSIASLIYMSIGILIGFISIDIIQYFAKGVNN